MTRFGLVLAGIGLLASAAAAHDAAARSMAYSWGRAAPHESAARNNYLSARYDRLLQVSPSFRRYRMWKECHTINFSRALRSDCIGSFDQYEPRLY